MTGQGHARRRLTYIGKRITAFGRLVGFWVDEEGTQYGYRKALGPAAPGARYDVAFTADGSVLLGGVDAPRYVDRLPPEDERALEWSARDRAAQEMHAQAARARRDAGPRRPGVACRPLQQLYAGERTAVGRAVLLAALIEQITRPLSRSGDERPIR